MSILEKFKKVKKPKAPWAKYYTKEELNIETPDNSVYDLISDAASNYAGYNALNYFGKKMTYREFMRNIDRCAKAFRCQGIRENDVVTLLMPNTPEGVIAFYALNKIGAIANMVHPLSAQEEIKEYLISTGSVMLIMIDVCYEKVKNIIHDTDVYKTVVVSAKDSMPMLLSIGYEITQGVNVKRPKKNEEYLYWKDFIRKGDNYTGEYNVKTGKDHVAVILHSGGTTGTPKSIVLTNGNFNTLALQAQMLFKNVQPGDSILTIMPIFHGFGLGVSVHAVLNLKLEVILIPQFSAKTFDNLINKYHPNILVGVPTLYEALLSNKGLNDVDLSYVKYVISGGDSLTPALERKINTFLHERGSRAVVQQGYGMTECLAAVALAHGEAMKEGSIGIPFPGTYFKVVTPGTQDEVEYGVDGELCVCGPTVMLGYMNNEKETNEVLQIHEDGNVWLHTGDIGYMDKDGVIFYKQRLKRMIISSGYNIYPAQIEGVIESHEAVLKCSVIGVPHPYKVQVAKAYIVLKNGYSESFAIKKEIKELCEKNLAKFSIPASFEYRKSLPTTLIGKVNYRELEKENEK